MEKAFVGIDPGASGAIALLSQSDAIVSEFGCLRHAGNVLRGWSNNYQIILVALESVHAMPGQGVTSMFNFGRNVGQWEGLIECLGLPCVQPTPQTWQKGLLKKSDGKDTKDRSLTVARRIFPSVDLHCKGDHGKSDALLLALWAKVQSGAAKIEHVTILEDI